MATKRIAVTIQGQSPLLMHQFPMIQVEVIEKLSAAEQAELAAYRDPEGRLYVPGLNLQRACVAGATFSKGKGRASLQKSAAACLVVTPEYVLLGQDTYAIDAWPVAVPATKGRILRYRLRFETWVLTFELEYDTALLSDVQVRRIVDDTGSRVGLLDFRPERKGPFGRFVVTHWDDGGGPGGYWRRSGT